MNENRGSLWWSEIAGPTAMVQSIAEALLEARSVILVVPEDLPWRRQMRDAVEISLCQENDSLQISYVDCQTDCDAFIRQDGSIDIPNFLIQQFGLPETYNGYRRSSNITVQGYIINNSVLKDRIVWVKGMDRHQVNAWVEFCCQFRPNRTDRGLFVIESYQDVSV